MSVFLKNTTFHGILLDSLFDAASDNAHKKEVVRLLTEGLMNGAVVPLQTTVFSEDQVEQAFRYLIIYFLSRIGYYSCTVKTSLENYRFIAAGKHIGKVVIKVRDEEPAKVTKPKQKSVTAIPRTYINPDKTYILVGS